MGKTNEYYLNYAKTVREIERLRNGKAVWEIELATKEGRMKVADEIEPLGADSALLECLRGQ